MYKKEIFRTKIYFQNHGQFCQNFLPYISWSKLLLFCRNYRKKFKKRFEKQKLYTLGYNPINFIKIVINVTFMQIVDMFKRFLVEKN